METLTGAKPDTGLICLKTCGRLRDSSQIHSLRIQIYKLMGTYLEKGLLR